MKLVRSWPAVIPKGRAYVQDQLDRLVMDDYDYRVLVDLDDDVALIEWDIAVDKSDLERFLTRAAENPDEVRVAPYRLFESTPNNKPLPKPFWVHRRFNGSPANPLLTTRYVDEHDPTCHMFGFGLVYLPRRHIHGFVDWAAGRKLGFSDAAFSQWHYLVGNPGCEVPIDWNCRAVHLHYSTVTVPASYSRFDN